MMADLKTMYTLLFLGGFCLRYMMISNSHIHNLLARRIEVSTPLSSWRKAIEGACLAERGINPYESDTFHESPLMLLIYQKIYLLGKEFYPLIFSVCDTITAAILALATHSYLNSIVRKESKSKRFPEGVSDILLKPQTVRLDPLYVAALYLFGPFTLASCGGCSTAVFMNLLLSLFVLMTSLGNLYEASMVLAFISYQSFYHITLLAPLLIYAYKRYDVPNSKGDVPKLLNVISGYLFTTSVLLYWSYSFCNGSWKWVEYTYGFSFLVTDLTPNFGVFWYFFTEMFEHFRVFFLWTFQLNVFVYTIPLAIRLRKQPMMLTFVLLVVIVLFKPYPCIGDAGFYISLVPMWSHLFRFMKQCFLVGCTYISCIFLGPVLWHLWIYNGSANANFFFGITLAFNIAQIFLFIDFMSGCIKREFYLENGIKTDDDGKMRRLRLK